MYGFFCIVVFLNKVLVDKRCVNNINICIFVNIFYLLNIYLCFITARTIHISFLHLPQPIILSLNVREGQEAIISLKKIKPNHNSSFFPWPWPLPLTHPALEHQTPKQNKRFCCLCWHIFPASLSDKSALSP